jgi:hypothetical protein
MAHKNIDDDFAATEGIEVYSSKKFFRYRKRYKQGLTAKGRKQGQFHDKTKNLTAGVRRD